MRQQPHKHHEGPITVELCEGLMKDFAQMGQDVPWTAPEVPGLFETEDEWYVCRKHWLQQFEYASLRLQEIIDDIDMGAPLRPSLHGKIVDICLSIKDDFEHACLENFVKPEYK